LRIREYLKIKGKKILRNKKEYFKISVGYMMIKRIFQDMYGIYDDKKNI